MTNARPLIPTTVPGLDSILGGGLTPGSLVFLIGTAGAGKTILASQILFGAVAAGAPALILTVFSEGHVKLIEHLNSLAFFDQQVVGRELNLLALQTVIGKEPDTAAATLMREIRQTNARLVLIDGFQGIAGVMESERDVRRMIAALANLVSYLDVTLLVTLEGISRSRELSDALTTADVVLGMDYAVEGWRHTRRLEVIKQRGRAHLPGMHSYQITHDGVTVFPRLEVRPHLHHNPRPSGRAPFGLPELDALLDGGLTTRTTTVVAGAPGVGKTTLGLHWALQGATPTDNSIMVSMAEHPDQLRAKAAAFGLDLDPAIASGALTLIYMPPVEITPDLVAAHLLEAITPTTRRVIIDNLAVLMLALGARGRDYLSALTAHLYDAGITSMFLVELQSNVGLHLDLVETPLSLISDNIIILQQQIAFDVLHRVLAVLKMRYSDHDRTLRELILDPHGIRVLSPTESEPGVLRGVAEDGGGFAPPEASDSSDGTF